LFSRALPAAEAHKLLRRAAEISSEGHREAMKLAEPTREYELQAALEYAFTRRFDRLLFNSRQPVSSE